MNAAVGVDSSYQKVEVAIPVGKIYAGDIAESRGMDGGTGHQRWASWYMKSLPIGSIISSP